MNSLEDIWQDIIQKLAETDYLTPTAVKTWLADCQPIELGDRRLVIQAPTVFTKNTIQKRFESTIVRLLSELFACDFELLVLVDDEVAEYLEGKKTDDALPEALDYTFDRFIVGESNKYAYSAAYGVAENPGKAFNPLFIYGNSGLGKTHLLLAIGQAIREKDPDVKIGYVKGDEFMNQMVRSLRENTQEEFRQKYRYVDLFLVDDIQFIAGKSGTQDEFFHTFNAIFEAGHQIVITSDRPPKDMASLEDRLRSRFEGGLMADILPPDLETRMAIIRNKSQRLGLFLSDEVVAYIAETLTENIRQIEGVVNKLTAYRDIDDTIDINSVKRAIKDVIKSGVYIPTPEVIITETGRYFNIDADEIRGKNRSKNTALARQIAMYLVRRLSNLTLIETGQEFSDRNHSTVLNSIRKVEELMSTDTQMAAIVRDITANINSLHDR